MTARPDALYDEDFYAWTRDQAGALRRLADQRWNGPLDLIHLAEEVEDLGSERQNAIMSQLERAMEHLLKLEHSARPEPRRRWMISVIDARGEIERRMTASIRREVEPALANLYRRARSKVELSLIDHRELEAAETLPAACPFGLDDLIADDWWPPNRHGLKDEW